jgi:hypothetical protein
LRTPLPAFVMIALSRCENPIGFASGSRPATTCVTRPGRNSKHAVTASLGSRPTADGSCFQTDGDFCVPAGSSAIGDFPHRGCGNPGLRAVGSAHWNLWRPSLPARRARAPRPASPFFVFAVRNDGGMPRELALAEGRPTSPREGPKPAVGKNCLRPPAPPRNSAR